MKPCTKSGLFRDNEIVSPETISTMFAGSVLSPKRPILVARFHLSQLAEKMVAKRVALCREFLTVSETTSWAFMFVSARRRAGTNTIGNAVTALGRAYILHEMHIVQCTCNNDASCCLLFYTRTLQYAVCMNIVQRE